MNDAQYISDSGAKKQSVVRAIEFGKIPEYLRTRKQWCVWQYQLRPGDPKPTKVPLKPFSHVPAKSNDPATWSDFATALWDFERTCNAPYPRVHGIGYFMGDGDIGIDIDGCIENGSLTPAATEVINRLGSYAEVSPSGQGVRIFCRGRLPAGGRKTGPFEIYGCGSNRFLTCTSQHLPGTPRTVEESQEAVNWYHQTFIYSPAAKAILERKAGSNGSASNGHSRGSYLPADPDAAKIIEAAAADPNTGQKFRRLMEGDISDYPSHSEADAGLVALIAYYAGPRVEVIDSVYRQSGLYRDKWDQKRGESTYGETTIEKFMGLAQYHEWRTVEEFLEGFEAQLNPTGRDHASFDDPDALEGDHDSFDDQQPQQKVKSEKPPRERRPKTLEELEAQPDLTFQVDKHLYTNCFAIVFGASGSGKSFFCLDMAMCVATGRPFLGVYPVTKGKVLYVCSEGGAGIKYRARAWLDYHKLPSTADILFLDAAYDLMQEDESAALLQDAVKAFGCQPNLVIIDTLSRNIGGGDDRTNDVNQYVTNVDYMISETQGTVISVHHTGHENASRPRGAKNLIDASDIMLRLLPRNLEDVAHNSESTVHQYKIKEGEGFEDYRIEKNIVGRSCVWTLKNQNLTRWDKVQPHLKRFLRAIYGQFGINPFKKSDADKLTLDQPEGIDQPKERTKRAYLSALIEDGWIVESSTFGFAELSQDASTILLVG